MDKGRRDVRRGTNRLSYKQSGEVNSGHEDHLQDMGCDEFSPPSDREVGTKKPKLLKRTFKDANGVDHASVPRKLRSAMKKRNCDSVSRTLPAPKKLNRSKPRVRYLKKDCIKKEEPETESKDDADPITKDEEEVAEMLFALAGMFPEVVTTDESGKLDGASSDVKALHLPVEKDVQTETAKVATEVDSNLILEAGHTMVESSEATVSLPSSAKTEQCDEMPLEKPENLHGSKGTLDFLGRLKPISADKTEPSDEKMLGIAFTTAEAVENKLATAEEEYKSSGLALWPGLSLSVPKCPRDHVLPKPSATRIPPWMGSAESPSKKTFDPSLMEQKKSNRCASHIYISRLIKVLQTSKIPQALQQVEPRSYEEGSSSVCGVPDSMAVRDMRSRFEKVTTVGDTVNSPAKRYSNIYLDKCGNQNANLMQDMTRLATELYWPQPSQHQKAKTFPMPQSCHLSPAYNNQHPATAFSHQGRLQFPQYLASPFAATHHHHHHHHHTGSIAFSNHHRLQHHQQQQQQCIWAAQCRQAGNSMTLMSQSKSSLQNVKPELTLNLSNSSQSSKISRQPFSSPGYNNITQQQQQQQRLMATAAATMVMPINHHHTSRAVMNRREHHFPLVYEETRTPLQLLCNEQS